MSAPHDEPVDLGPIRAHPVGSHAVPGPPPDATPADSLPADSLPVAPGDPYGRPPGPPMTDQTARWRPYDQRSLRPLAHSIRTGAAGMAHDIVDAHRGPKVNSRPLPDWVRGLAWLLDESIPLPAGRHVGVEGMLSFIPGIGDAAGLAASMVVVLAGVGAGVSLPTLTLMMINVGVDTIIGAVPFIGAFFDLGYKSNTKNLRLIEKDLHDRARARRSAFKVLLLSVLAIFLSTLLMFIAFFGSLWLTYLLVQRLF